MFRRSPVSPLFPYTTLFPSFSLVVVTCDAHHVTFVCSGQVGIGVDQSLPHPLRVVDVLAEDNCFRETICSFKERSEEHTSELQSLTNLVCRLLLEKKKSRST